MTANIESQHKIFESGKKVLENGVELAIYSNLPQEIKDLTWVEEGLTCIYQRWFRSITLAVCDRNRVLKLLEYAHIAPTINEFISDDDNDVYTVKICWRKSDLLDKLTPITRDNDDDYMQALYES